MKDAIIQEFLKYNSSFLNSEIEAGLLLFETKEFKAKDLVLETGKVSKYLFFAESSITRCFYHNEQGQEHTLWMKPEKTFITEYKSFVNQNESQFNLQFYEDTSVFMISRSNLDKLYSQSKNWSLFGKNLIENTHVTLIDVFVNLLANDATRNYQYIEYMFPRFLQVAPLKDIASMLQVSQVTLSRIRSGTQLKK